MFYLLLLIPAIVGIFVFAVRTKRKRLARFGKQTTITQLMPEASPRRVRNKFILRMYYRILYIVYDKEESVN